MKGKRSSSVSERDYDNESHLVTHVMVIFFQIRSYASTRQKKVVIEWKRIMFHLFWFWLWSWIEFECSYCPCGFDISMRGSNIDVNRSQQTMCWFHQELISKWIVISIGLLMFVVCIVLASNKNYRKIMFHCPGILNDCGESNLDLCWPCCSCQHHGSMN